MPWRGRRAARRMLLWVLLLAAVAAGGAAQAGTFDWRTRGVLFRVVALPVQTPAPAVDADGGAAAVDLEAADVEAGDVEADLPSTTVAATAEPSYIFATIHYGTPDALLLSLPALRHHLAQTTVLVNEVDLGADWQPEYESYRRLPEGQRLQRMIGEDAFAELQRLLPDRDPAALDRLKPWVAMSLLEFPFDSDEKSIDALLQDWATAGGLRKTHLENLPDQLAALDCVPAHEYARVLQQRLLGGWSFDLDAERTVGYYRERDLAAWLDDIDGRHGLTGAALAAEAEAQRCLISVRNARWLPVLQDLLRAGGAFVAVGAIHLTGEQGLLVQLSRSGFDVSVEPW
ncbi:TraB/GumN family protein [Luteimonas sp. BDR2-5]|uniref:TraB/GumN family protein n=1 Tax=Proluteimonas luteida TaxID=2878685 RepID=UPI001E6246AA|nr:TraB/GumN family protein [Luteimonas sp. BDR2-5]MCD9029085.1 TraB/GumN family protein [Luteimonas sp. BDR2-5]